MARWLSAYNITLLHALVLLISGVDSLTFPYKRSRISGHEILRRTALQHFAGEPSDDENAIQPNNRLMVFGLGNVGSLIAERSSSLQVVNSTFFNVVLGTTRSTKSIPGVQAISFDAYRELEEVLPLCTHILVTIPPMETPTDLGGDINATLVGGRPRRWKYFCDAVLNHPNFCLQDLVPANTWIGFISSTSVYGNHDGKWVTEDSEVKFEPGTKGGQHMNVAGGCMSFVLRAYMGIRARQFIQFAKEKSKHLCLMADQKETFLHHAYTKKI